MRGEGGESGGRDGRKRWERQRGEGEREREGKKLVSVNRNIFHQEILIWNAFLKYWFNNERPDDVGASAVRLGPHLPPDPFV